MRNEQQCSDRAIAQAFRERAHSSYEHMTWPDAWEQISDRAAEIDAAEPAPNRKHATVLESIEWLDRYYRESLRIDPAPIGPEDIAALRALIDVPAPAALPAGFVLVPAECTDEMISAVADVPDHDDVIEEGRAIWRAMLAAAPKPQEPRS